MLAIIFRQHQRTDKPSDYKVYTGTISYNIGYLNDAVARYRNKPRDYLDGYYVTMPTLWCPGPETLLFLRCVCVCVYTIQPRLFFLFPTDENGRRAE
jgi:hypothetical protein